MIYHLLPPLTWPNRTTALGSRRKPGAVTPSLMLNLHSPISPLGALLYQACPYYSWCAMRQFPHTVRDPNQRPHERSSFAKTATWRKPSHFCRQQKGFARVE